MILLKDILSEVLVKNKKSGNLYNVSKMNPQTQEKPTPKDIEKAKKSDEKPNQNIFGKLKNFFSNKSEKSNTSKEYKLKTGENIKIKLLNKREYPGYSALDVAAFDKDGNEIASVHFNSDETNKKNSVTSSDTMVKTDWRRKGVASNMYNFVSDLGYKVLPSANQTPDGKEFSKKYNKNN